MTYSKLYILFLILFFSINIIAQTNKNCNIEIEKFAENIKLNTDRDIYFNGERIYYSADYFINRKQTSTVLSNILYVELINCKNNLPIVQKKIKLSNFKANDVIVIPSNIISGNYVLRVYTQYQRNFSVYNYAYHFLTILNPKNSQFPLIYDIENDSIEIVPESNMLIENLNNKLIIRVPLKLISNQNKYYITKNDSLVVKDIYISKGGFAQQELFIENGNYKFKIQRKDGNIISVDFPKIVKFGIKTSIENFNEDIIYKIQPKGIGNKKLNYNISTFSYDYKLNYSKVIKFDKEDITLVLPKKTFRTGLNYIVLFNDKGEIEKINSLFFSNKKFNNIEIEIEKNTFNTNEDAEIILSLNNEKETDFFFNAIVTVGLYGTKKESNYFIPNLYLSNPIMLQEYLFSLNENNHLLNQQIMILFDKRIDKDFFLKKVNKFEVPTFKYIPDIRDLSIKGVLRNKTTKKSIPEQDVFLSVLFNSPQLHVCKTNNNGNFIFSVNKIKNINDVFICTKPTSYKQESEIVINNSFSTEIPNFGVLPTFITDNNKELVEKIYVNSQFEKNKNKSYKHNRKKTEEFNISFDKEAVYIKDFIKLKNLEEFFFEVIPSVKYKKVNGEYKFTVYNDKGIELPESPLVLLDNIPIFDLNKIKLLNISDIEKIDVINKKYYLGSSIFQGVIMITSKNTEFAGVELPNTGIFIEYNGIDQVNKSRIINNYKAVSNSIPDFRTILYWNPSFKLTTEKKNVIFKTSNSKGTYNIKVKAYNSKGDVYYGNKQITVK